MDEKVEILLGSEKNINSVNTDSYSKIELTRNTSELTEFTVNDVVNSTEVFDEERAVNQVYRIYGRIEWMSLLNGLTNSLSRELADFFNPIYSGDSKNLIDNFDFYLVAPSSDATYNTIVGTGGTQKRRNFEVIASKNDIEIYNAGFTNNVYGEQVYSFNFKSDFDVSDYYDNLGFPLTELFLYAQYITLGSTDAMSRTTWTSFGGVKNKVDLTTKDLEIGDIVENHQGSNIQDLIEYQKDEYFQKQIDPQLFYIRTEYDGTEWLEWSYNPFIPFRLRYLDGVVSTAQLPEILENTSSFSIEIAGSPSTNFTATKLLKKSLTTTTRTIDDWDEQSTTLFDWNYNTGVAEFTIPASFTYEISFQTEIRLPLGTDKYIAETWLEENTTGSWVEILDLDLKPITRRKYQISSPIQTAKYTRTYGYGDKIRIRVSLIPNPDERKVFRIPDYAKMIEADGKYVWRNILPQGYVDPTTNLGVDYPFFNKRRYLFEPIVFDVIPNLNEDLALKHDNTLTVFDEISYYKDPISLDETPLTELDDIEKPCQ